MRPSGMVLLMVTAFAVSYRTKAYHNHHQFSSSPESQQGSPRSHFVPRSYTCVQTPQSAHTNGSPTVPRPIVVSHVHTRKDLQGLGGLLTGLDVTYQLVPNQNNYQAPLHKLSDLARWCAAINEKEKKSHAANGKKSPH